MGLRVGAATFCSTMRETSKRKLNMISIRLWPKSAGSVKKKENFIRFVYVLKRARNLRSLLSRFLAVNYGVFVYTTAGS